MSSTAIVSTASEASGKISSEIGADSSADSNLFTIDEKYLNPEADICLNWAVAGKRFDSLQPILLLIVTLKKTVFSEELREKLFEALDSSFTILRFDFKPFAADTIKLTVELAAVLHPEKILSVIETIFEKGKSEAL